MKIFVFNFEYPPLGGGGGVATRDIATILAKRHEVHVITTGWKGLPAREEHGSLVIHRVSVPGRRQLPTATILSMALYVPVALWKSWRLARANKPDVINAQFVLPSGLPAAGLSWLVGSPLVVSLIGGDIYDPSKGVSPHRHAVLRWLVRCVCRYACARTAISSDTRRRAVEMHGIKEPIEVVPLGLAPIQCAVADRRELGLPADKALFVSIGRLIARKRYEDLLEAWQAVDGACLVIIGSGQLEGEIKEKVSKLGLDSRVSLAGQVSDERKCQILNVADGYVSSAEHEGFGIVFLEAMQAGLPIVSANDGGQRDFLEEGVNALMVSPRDKHALAREINRLVENKELRGKMGVANREKVKDFYLDRTVTRLEKVLIRVAKHC